MIRIRYNRLKSFFDKNLVLRFTDRLMMSVLRQVGAYTFGIARRSIKKGKEVSFPGTPPITHTGFLPKSIFFAVEKLPANVVIGPIPRGVYSDVPPVLEYGGRLRLRARGKRVVGATYRARPFMGPAFERATSKLDDFWARAVAGK